jgi:hypothetical protein
MKDKGIITVALFLSLFLNYTPFLSASGQENGHKNLDRKNASCVQPEMIEIIKDGMSSIYQMKDGEKTLSLPPFFTQNHRILLV